MTYDIGVFTRRRIISPAESYFAVPAALSSGGCAEATAFLTRALVAYPSLNSAHQGYYTDLICGLVTDGVWSQLDVLQVYATSDTSVAVLNLKGATGAATFTGATLTADRGFNITTAGDVVDTNFTPSTSGVNYTLNAASLGVWIVVNSSPTVTATIGAGANCEMYTPYSDGHFYSRINDSTYAGGTIVGSGGLGFYLGVRTSSTGRTGYFNGASDSSGTATSTSLAAVSVQLGNVLSIQAAAFVAGGNIDSVQNALYTRLRTYMTAVGVP